MVKQKVVLKLSLEDETKRRKALKTAVAVTGVTSATLDGDKITVVGDGVDPIALTTMLRRRLGYAELISVSSGDEKKKDGSGGKDSESKGAQPVPVPYTYQYNAVPSYPAYAPYPYNQDANQDPGCSIM